jgi:outer membrane protein assembly factor BamB
MFMPLNDLTAHRGLLLAVTRKYAALGGGELPSYVNRLHNADFDRFRDYLFSVSADTGDLNWKHETQGVERIAAAVGNTIYLHTDRELLAQTRTYAEDLARAGKPRKNLPSWTPSLQALDPASGKLLWLVAGAKLLVATESLAYIQLEDGSVEAVDSRTGKTLYKYALTTEAAE